jgi:hypothetical protein
MIAAWTVHVRPIMSKDIDLSSILPEPQRLRRTAAVHFQWGDQSHRFTCIACSVRRAPDPGSGEEIDWLHCKGFQDRPVSPGEVVPTMAFVVPVTYITHIAYGRGYTLGEHKPSVDVAVFPPIHPPPAVRLSLDQVREIISELQVQEGSHAPHLYDDYVRSISERFERALQGIRTEHNFEYGNEFEVALCKTIRLVLPQKYGICRGYVVSAWGEKAGDDIIIYDRMSFPTLRALETDDYSLKEQVPIEAVYAYIEAKHSICLEGDGGTSFQKALNQVGRVKLLVDQRPAVEQEPSSAMRMPGWPTSRNPAYGIIISRHVRLREGGPVIEDPQVILRHLLDAEFQVLRSPDFCVFGRSNMWIPVMPGAGGQMDMPSPFFQLKSSSPSAVIVDKVGFGAGLSLLLWALDWIQLGKMPWPAILKDCIPPTRE